MKPDELSQKHEALVEQAMQNIGIETAMRIFQAAQPAVNMYGYAVSASTAHLQSTTAARVTPIAVR